MGWLLHTKARPYRRVLADVDYGDIQIMYGKGYHVDSIAKLYDVSTSVIYCAINAPVPLPVYQRTPLEQMRRWLVSPKVRLA